MLKTGPMRSVRKYFDFVRFEHTVFALLFALAAIVVSARDVSATPEFARLQGDGLVHFAPQFSPEWLSGFAVCLRA